MEITDGGQAIEGIGCAVPVMKIEIEDEGAFDLLLTEKFLDGNSNIVEIAEPPAGMGAGMVPWRPDQAESGLAFKSHLRRQNCPSGGKDPNLIDLRLPFNKLNVIPSMDSLEVSL